MLNDRQIRFCEEYLANGNNATQAAISAGYSEQSARDIGYENLTKPDISAYIEERQAQILARLQINQDRIAREYARIAFPNIKGLYNEDGSFKNIHDIDEEGLAIIAGIETEEIRLEGITIGHTKKVKHWDKIRALDALSKFTGFFEKDNNQKNQVNKPDWMTKEVPTPPKNPE